MIIVTISFVVFIMVLLTRSLPNVSTPSCVFGVVVGTIKKCKIIITTAYILKRILKHMIDIPEKK